MNITLICTVYNEGDSITPLLESVLDQARQPDEAVFVDAGSEDGTLETLREYEEDFDWIRVVVDEGCNIAEGRNKAVSEADYDYIVGTDGGCTLEPRWCKAMEEAFEEGHEALSGLWKPSYSNTFEMVQGKIRGNYIEKGKIPENWPPSSRSIGFTRQVWEDAGGYPEHLYTGEDAKYNSNVRRAGYEWHVVEDAWVDWQMRPTLKAYWNQFYTYGEGDARAGNLFDYPGKIFGVSKVFWRTAATGVGLTGLILAAVHPAFLLLTVGGFGSQLVFKAGALRASVNQGGLKTIPYWLTLVLTGAIAHFTGYMVEKVRNLG